MLIEATTEIGSRITSAIQQAAQTTGAGFDYLLKTALQESNFDPTAKAGTSSATGLFQFIDQTWLSTVKDAGPQLGYGQYANSIVKTSSGNYVVPDPAARSQIMNLRNDPAANAVMAGAFTTRNAADLARGLGRKATDGELYVAHVLGPYGAVKLITGTAKTPQASAADTFPSAARANRSIFYDRQGGARSLSQVYSLLTSKIDAVAVPPVQTPAPAPASAPVPPAPAIVAVNTVAGPQAMADSTSAPQAVAYAADNTPMFQGLFRTDRRGPVSPMVAQLWGAGSAASMRTQTASAVAPAAAATGTSAPGRLGKPLDLFQFLRPEIRASVAVAG